MIAAGIASGHYALADWLFLIAAILLVVFAVLVNSPRSIPTGRGAAMQAVAIALIALGLLFL